MTELTETLDCNQISELILDVTITYLEMLQKPADISTAPDPKHMSVRKINEPTLSFYRYLYCNIGQPWRWYERRVLSDDELTIIIHDPNVSVYVLYSQGSPAGYFELDGRIDSQIELAYFGLLPQFIGKGLGSWLLSRALVTAWHAKPKRVWVHTCNLDHPNALLCYQKAGFKAYRKEIISIRDPWLEPYWDVALSENFNEQKPDVLS